MRCQTIEAWGSRVGSGRPVPASIHPENTSIHGTNSKLVDLLWQTDEPRVVRPDPKDEARSAIYYLQTLSASVVPDLLGELDRVLAGIGDGNPNVTPEVTLEVLGLQHEYGLRVLLAGGDEPSPTTPATPGCRCIVTSGVGGAAMVDALVSQIEGALLAIGDPDTASEI